MDIAKETDDEINQEEEESSGHTENASGLTGAVDKFTSRKSDLQIAFSGKLIDDRFLIEKRIGSGGAGTVFLATDTKTDKQVAIKVLGKRGTFDEASLRRFNQETRVTRYLKNAHIVRVFEYGIAEEHPFFVMEYLSGGTLQDLLKDGAISEAECLKILRQICEAVAYAHGQGVIHRDIKPNNIMFVDATREKVKLLDFGVSKTTTWDIDHEVLNTEGTLFGTPLYFAPERIDGKDADVRSDIYSLGCVIYECLTGKPPHVGSTSVETLRLHQTKDIPSLRWKTETACTNELDRIVMKMVKRRPKLRYQKIEELIADLTKHADGNSSNPTETAKRNSSPPERVSQELEIIDLIGKDVNLFGEEEIKHVEPSKREITEKLQPRAPAGFYSSVAELEQLIGERFGRGLRLERLIGKGISSGVFLASQWGTETPLAVKVLCKEAARDKRFRDSFLQEARIVEELQHRYIVRSFEQGIEKDLLFFSMEFLDGGSIAELLNRRVVHISPDATLIFIEQLIDALEFAHKQGIIHRSVQPENIMFLNTSRKEIRVIDFGKCIRLSDSIGAPSFQADYFGPVDYVSPELANGERGDERSDIYSLGCVAYECLTGNPPALSSTIVPIWQTNSGKDCPAWLEHVIMNCLERDVGKRYQTMAEVKYYVQNLKKGSVVAPRQIFVSSKEPTVVQKVPDKQVPTQSDEPDESEVTVTTLQKALLTVIVALSLVAIYIFGSWLWGVNGPTESFESVPADENSSYLLDTPVDRESPVHDPLDLTIE